MLRVYSRDKEPLRSTSIITEILFVLSQIHTWLSGVLQMPFHVLPSQGILSPDRSEASIGSMGEGLRGDGTDLLLVEQKGWPW